MGETRTERDFLGEKEIPAGSLWGIHTARALENFPVSGLRVHPRLIRAFGLVKLACATVNQRLGYLSLDIGTALGKAAREMSDGKLDEHILVDAFQGGAGTSTNLNVCEVLANRALQLLGKKPGQYEFCDPIEHVNQHQSTNDTYPSALKVAVLQGLKDLEQAVNLMQETLQAKEKEFAQVLKIGRTELMDAVPMTLGRAFGAWADALSRDRWRVFKATERIRVINLGGTAIGTGLGAPREYIFQATDELRRVTGLPLARAENLMDATQNLDVFVEIMGMLKAHAANLMKIAADLRMLAMGPDAGIGEIHLPAMQTGSSIMPGKINPVMTEMMSQVGIQVMAYDQAIAWAVASGQLELNAFLPLIAHNMLHSLDLLMAADQLGANRCLKGLEADGARSREWALRSSALAAVLVPAIGYHKAAEVASYMRQHKCTLPEAALQAAGLDPAKVLEMLSPENVNSLGFKKDRENNPA